MSGTVIDPVDPKSDQDPPDEHPADSPPTGPDEPAESGPGMFSREELFWELSPDTVAALEDQFDRYDIDESGFIDTEAELNLLATNVAYLAFSEPFNLNVGSAEIDEFIELCLPLLDEGSPPGVNKTLYVNLIVCIYCFELADGTKPDRNQTIRQTKAKREEKAKTYPYNDPELDGFVEWWEDIYGVDYLSEHPGDGPNKHDAETELILEKAKLEFKAAVRRRDWELKRADNIAEWRRCIRENQDISKCQSEEEHLVFEIKNAKMIEKLARKERNLVGKNVLWLRGASCISDETCLWQYCSRLRADAGWQWFMLIVNIVNVLGLISQDTSCNGTGDQDRSCGNSYQDDVLPALDLTANILFTIDMLNSWIVLGFRSYFDDMFNILDFFVVVTGWLDVAQVGMDFSALRALRVQHSLFFALTIDESEAFILSTGFDFTIIAIICLNSIFLAIDHYKRSRAFGTMLYVAEWSFNVVFTIEMLMKFYCLKGFCNYWRFGSNKFDFFIVVTSWLNMITESAGIDVGFIRVFRIFRALRLTRVLRKIESVRKIIDAAFNSMQPIINILMFMIVVLVVYGCMGMQLYGSQFDFTEDDEYPPRQNFDI